MSVDCTWHGSAHEPWQCPGPDTETEVPSLDLVEEIGFDGSLRGLDGRPAGEPVTWQELAHRALALLREHRRGVSA